MCTQTYSDNIFSKNFCGFIARCFPQTLRSITQPWNEVACPGGLIKVATAENPCPWMAVYVLGQENMCQLQESQLQDRCTWGLAQVSRDEHSTDGRVSCARLRSGVPVCYTASCMTQPGEEPGLRLLQRAPGQGLEVRRSRRTGGHCLFLLHSWCM